MIYKVQLIIGSLFTKSTKRQPQTTDSASQSNPLCIDPQHISIHNINIVKVLPTEIKEYLHTSNQTCRFHLQIRSPFSGLLGYLQTFVPSLSHSYLYYLQTEAEC